MIHQHPAVSDGWTLEGDRYDITWFEHPQVPEALVPGEAEDDKAEESNTDEEVEPCSSDEDGILSSDDEAEESNSDKEVEPCSLDEDGILSSDDEAEESNSDKEVEPCSSDEDDILSSEDEADICSDADD